VTGSETAVVESLDWLLDDLVERVPAARYAVLLSVDGLVLGASATIGREESEHLAAAAAGLASLARGTGRRFAAGALRQTIVELTDAYLLVSAAGPGACLAVFTAPDTDLGLLAYEAELMVARVGEHLSAPVRPPHPTGR
jgi:predicted regulator of Ras-like GTPase activity (Roadblock/LC7/MglB family)